jgi:hypothetical protein
VSRRVVYTKGVTRDREDLVVIQVFEEGVNKEKLKKESILTKVHDVLIKRGDLYEYRA